MRRGIAIAVAFVSVNCGGGDQPAPWQPCDQFECADIEVPIDWSDPDGPTMTIAAVRSHALEEEERVGVVLVNTGGPGAPLVDTFLTAFAGLAALAPDLVNRFDLIGFDPRGTGHSSQAECLDDATIDELRAIDLAPDDAGELTARADAIEQFQDGCVDGVDPRLLDNLHSEAVARDMDAIRGALEEETINYVGISYGTVLGSTYMRMFPERVRAFVLDSPVDVTAPSRLELFDHQARGYERALDRFLADCGADSACAFHGGGGTDAVGAALDALLASVEAQPVDVDGRTLGIVDVYAALQTALRGAEWDRLAGALADAEAGDGVELLTLAGELIGRTATGGYNGFLEALVAIACLDRPLPDGLELDDFDAYVATTAESFPRMAVPVSLAPMWCVGWPGVRPEAIVRGATDAPPALVVAGLYDGATPYEGVDPFLDSLGNGSYLLTYEGDGHGQIFHECPREHAIAYLIDPTSPPAVTTCPAE